MARKNKTLAEQLAELDNPAPKDFDPEEDVPPSDSDEDSVDEDNEKAARDHYVNVGKSKLRKRDVVPLGPQYEGSKVSRDAVTENDDDEDDPFSKGFDEEDSDDEDDVDGVQEESASDEDDEVEEGESEDGIEDLRDGEESPATDLSDEEDEDEEDDEDDEEPTEDRAELRKMMAEEQKSVAATLSQAAKQDAEKGRAVKAQRTTFDSLLNVRIKLQKALIGTNTISGLPESDDASDESDDTPEDAFRAAETAAFTLWSSLNSLRETLETSRNGRKRTHDEFTLDTPTDDLWAHMKAQEASSNTYRNSVLEKWSAKARGATSIAPRNRLNNTASQQTIVDVLNEQLNSSDRLIKRARTPRSCAPLQLKQKLPEANNIYDDADFYGLLLQSLLEQRSADSVAASASHIDVGFHTRREAKTKKNVDTKASKGRKLRYTVHEKLQNFMAPEDRGSWGERQADELFGSLFGARSGLLEEDEDEVQKEDGDVDMEEAGLMMFRS